MTVTQKTIIAQTKYWVDALVVGHNICPFARKEVKNNRIRYLVSEEVSLSANLALLIDECQLLDENRSIETTILILPKGCEGFYGYLDWTDSANLALINHGYEGIYQLATFHPDYCFEGATDDDPANYTNRSPYPMLHILRESSLDMALANYKEPESIPERNIAYVREKGSRFFIELLKQCMEEGK